MPFHMFDMESTQEVYGSKLDHLGVALCDLGVVDRVVYKLVPKVCVAGGFMYPCSCEK